MIMIITTMHQARRTRQMPQAKHRSRNRQPATPAVAPVEAATAEATTNRA